MFFFYTQMFDFAHKLAVEEPFDKTIRPNTHKNHHRNGSSNMKPPVHLLQLLIPFRVGVRSLFHKLQGKLRTGCQHIVGQHSHNLASPIHHRFLFCLWGENWRKPHSDMGWTWQLHTYGTTAETWTLVPDAWATSANHCSTVPQAYAQTGLCDGTWNLTENLWSDLKSVQN